MHASRAPGTPGGHGIDASCTTCRLLRVSGAQIRGQGLEIIWGFIGYGLLQAAPIRSGADR